ncbi:uncharacterized protein LOC115632217 [Scaptodrosophila lebanonensis]|uniref:Uncharacterized protein LOC115632217 n=1 Tax=Drosophila lebanonensis TaxID=7225 RepID=A0A6J2UAT9_DROLE|nr:uncharacterized protein LOC115632217 [Scaptodrosophila lebanonensis]
MGRLFQYNRFGATDSANKRKKDTQNKTNSKAKLLRNAALNCPAYSDIYSEYNNGADAAATTTASKNLNLAFKKCQQWSNKLQMLDENQQPQEPQNAATTLSRTHKVYDSMKDFLRRKLFAQPVASTTMDHDKAEVLGTDEEATSDYDEHDLLDSSYNADVEEEYDEEEVEDCSCTSSHSASIEATPRRTKSPQKSLLSLNCWQSSQHSDTSSSEELAAEDSDAGISDCCQLLSGSSERSQRKQTRLPSRQSISHKSNDDDDDDTDTEESELLDCAWYQPRISAKAALEHLQEATPGTFLLRRSTPRTFELCLRLERKVKQYAVQSTRTDMYRLKGAKKQFSTLKALITHHSVMAEQLPLTLDMPREKHVVKCSAVRYADDFEPLESLQLLGILKSLQAKNFEV